MTTRLIGRIGLIVALSAGVVGVEAVGPATPVQAAVDYIEVTSTCTLDLAIDIANNGGFGGRHIVECPNYNPGTRTIRITANSGTTSPTGTTLLVPGVAVDLDTARSGPYVGGANTAFRAIEGDVTIEGDPSQPQVGIYAIEKGPRQPFCQLVIISQDPLIADTVCTDVDRADYGARLFYVAPSGTLTIRNLNVGGGNIEGSFKGYSYIDRSQDPPVTLYVGNPADTIMGGAIYAEGPLTLDSVTLQGNRIVAGYGQNAAGGAVFATTSLTVSSSVFDFNKVTGGKDQDFYYDVEPRDQNFTYAGGGSALGGAIGLGPQATAEITGSLIQNSQAFAADGDIGYWGEDGADGVDGVDGYCVDDPVDTATRTASGWSAGDGGPGGSGGNGGHGGSAVAVLWGGQVVTIDDTSIVNSSAIAGAAGAGGPGGVGGDGGDGGDAAVCTIGSHTPGIIKAVGGDAGNAGLNGTHGKPGHRGNAVATIVLADNGINDRSYAWLTNTTISNAVATVPEDNFGPFTLAVWSARRLRSDTTMAFPGTPGIGQDPTAFGGGDGEPGTRGGFSQPAEGEADMSAGAASMFGTNANSSTTVSHSTIADVSLGVPSDATDEQRLYRSAHAATAVTEGWLKSRASIWWNPSMAAVGCPTIDNSLPPHGYNVFHEGSGCRSYHPGDITTATPPISRFLVPLGPPIRPAYDDTGTPFRMPVRTFGPFAPPRNIVPAGECVTANAVPITYDARQSPRDQNCDAGAYEWARPTATEVWIYGPARMHRGAPEPSQVTITVDPRPAPATNLVVRVDGIDDVEFPPGFVVADLAPDNGWSRATYQFTGTEPDPVEFELALSAPLTGTDDVVVSARLEGLQQGDIVADPLVIDTLHDGEVGVSVTAPANWSPCRGYLPVTYTARSVGNSPAPASRVRVFPNVIPSTAGNGFETPLAVASVGTVTIDSGGAVVWNLPAFGPGDPLPTLTTYIAVGKLDPTQVSYAPGLTLTAAASVLYPPSAPNVNRANLPAVVKQIPIVNDLELLQGLLSSTDPTLDPPFDASELPIVVAGQPSQLFASLDVPPAGCDTPGTTPYRWSPIQLTVRDPVNPATPLLGQTDTFTVVDTTTGDDWHAVQFTAPDTPGVHYLEFEFAGPGSTPVKRLVPYRVRPVLLSLVSPDDERPEAITGREFLVQLEHPVSQSVSFRWTTVDSTAQAPSDFDLGDDTITIPAGQTEATINVNTYDDPQLESSEEFYVLIEPSTGNPLPPSVAIGRFVGRAVLVNDDHGLQIDGGTYVEGDAGTGSIEFYIFSILAPTADCTVGVSVVRNGTADADDVELASTQITVPGGGTGVLQEGFTLDDVVKGDVVDEDDETFGLQLSPGTSGTSCRIHAANGSATIIDDDTSTISIADVSLTEGTGSGAGGTVAVELSTPSAVDVSVDVDATPGTADTGDFSGAATVTIPAGSTSATAVVVTPDAIDESDETFTVALSNPVGATIADGTADVTIVDDDTATISVADVSVAEGTGAGTTTATFTIRLATPADHNVSVHAQTAIGTAGAGDFTATGVDVTITAESTSATVTVPITRDNEIELDETFTLTLSAPVGAPTGDATATGTIVNDDLPTVVSGAVTVPEGDDGSVTVPVTLSDPPLQPITVTVQISGCAAAGDGTQVTVTLPAGETSYDVELPIAGSTTPGDNQNCTVTVTGATGAVVDPTPAAVTIVDDDDWTVSGDTTVVVRENAGVARVTVRLNAPAPTGGLTFNYATADGSALTPRDYQAASGAATIPAGATSVVVEIAIVNDNNHEDDETFTVQLSSPRIGSGAEQFAEALLVGSPGSVTIQDDDPALGLLPSTGGELARLLLFAASALVVGVALRRTSATSTST